MNFHSIAKVSAISFATLYSAMMDFFIAFRDFSNEDDVRKMIF